MIGHQFGKSLLKICLVTLLTIAISVFCFGQIPAWASINDDRYDGNIFVVYAGNGSLVPPSLTLAESLQRHKPTLIVYYLDDSRDCKQFALIVSNLQAYYGRVASFIPVSIDTLPEKSSYTPQELGYYYEGFVPQTVLLDQEGKVAFNGKGQVKFTEVDDAFRQVFDLLPRSESKELKRRSFNEFNAELTE